MTTDVTRDEIIAAVVTREMTDRCAVCDRSVKWLIPQRGDTPDRAEIMMTVDPGDSLRGFAFVPMICPHCGNTRMIHLETLLKAAKAGHE